MIREERNPAFWYEIASHPACAGFMLGLPIENVVQASLQAHVLPLASDNGGYFFVPMDHLGVTAELHALYRPAGWGREADQAGKEALEWVFRTFQVVIAYEMESNDRSHPPASFGFIRADDWKETKAGSLRAWVLTRAAWEASPAYGRIHKWQVQ